MPLPGAIQIATLTFGSAQTFFGNDVEMTVTVTPTHNLTWAATGQPIISFARTYVAPPGMPGSIPLPVVDQAGFIDSSGNAFTMWAYRITIVYKTAEGVTWQATKNFQPLTGQSIVDLDLLPDGPIQTAVSAPIPEVLSVNGETGAVVVDEITTAERNALIELTTPTTLPAAATDLASALTLLNAIRTMLIDKGMAS